MIADAKQIKRAIHELVIADRNRKECEAVERNIRKKIVETYQLTEDDCVVTNTGELINYLKIELANAILKGDRT